MPEEDTSNPPARNGASKASAPPRAAAEGGAPCGSCRRGSRAGCRGRRLARGPAGRQRRGRSGRAREPTRPGGAQGDEHQEAGGGGERARDPGRRDHEEAGAGVPDPARPGREGGADLLRGRARDPARRLRLPARPRVLLPAGPRRHLRLALADPQVRPAHRRHHQRPDPPAEGRRALLRAHQGGRRQLRAARPLEGEDLLRQPHAALPAGPHPPRAPARGDHRRASSTCWRRSARASAR